MKSIHTHRTAIIVMSAILTLLFISLFAQYDEKEILANRARNLEMRGKYAEAALVYKELFFKFPQEKMFAERVIYNLLLAGDIEAAEEATEAVRSQIDEREYVRFKIEILLKKSKPDQAKKTSWQYINANAGDMQAYRQLSAVFATYRDYDNANEILLKGRDVSKDPSLFSLELARNYEAQNTMDKAISEYIIHLDKNPSYRFFIQSRLKEIVKEAPHQVDNLLKIAQRYENKDIKELVAVTLASKGRNAEALKYFQDLPTEKIKAFADEQKAAGALQIAKKAYYLYLSKETDQIKKAESEVDISRIYIEENQTDSAMVILTKLSTDAELQKQKYRTRVNQHCRELLAEIALLRSETPEVVIDFLTQAKQYSLNQKEQKQVDFKILNYQILLGETQKAEQLLGKISENEEKGTDIFNLSLYYSFLISSIKGEAQSDSFLTEMMVYMPESEFINDAFDLQNLITPLTPKQKELFFKAFRAYHLSKVSESVVFLDTIYKETLSEEILVLIGDWSLSAGLGDRALNAYSFNYNDDLLKGYSLIRMSKYLVSNNDEKKKILTDFLKTFPNHPLSPEFRHILESI